MSSKQPLRAQQEYLDLGFSLAFYLLFDIVIDVKGTFPPGVH